MGAERVRLGDVVELWGSDALVEIWGDNTVWISDARGEHRMPLIEWVGNDPRLDMLRCSGCGAFVERDDVIQEGTYSGGHPLESALWELVEPCGPVTEWRSR